MGKIRVKPYKNNNEKSSAYGKWFMRVHLNTPFDVNDLADHIQSDSKVERTEVATTNSAVNKQIAELLCNGHPIRIPHLGMLKLGVSSKGTETVSEFNAGTDIKDIHIVLVLDPEIKKELKSLKFEKFYYDMKPASE